MRRKISILVLGMGIFIAASFASEQKLISKAVINERVGKISMDTMTKFNDFVQTKKPDDPILVKEKYLHAMLDESHTLRYSLPVDKSLEIPFNTYSSKGLVHFPYDTSGFFIMVDVSQFESILTELFSLREAVGITQDGPELTEDELTDMIPELAGWTPGINYMFKKKS